MSLRAPSHSGSMASSVTTRSLRSPSGNAVCVWEYPVPVPRLPRRGVRVPSAGEPDPVHAESVDGEEADPPRVGGIRDVVHDQPGALGDAGAIGVLLVICEQEAIGKLHLVGVCSL